MNTILLKIHNAKQTVAEAVVVTKDGTPTTVKALKRVNYELIDQATDFAPHHIVTKRVAQDLHVSFEEDGQVTDLVIEGFYDAGDTALIGLAEDGQYYYFIPDTANESDYVTQLAVGDVEGQALGGMPYTAPWWVGATEKAGFPWIGLLAGIGGIIAFDDDDKGNRGNDSPRPDVSTHHNDGMVSVTPKPNANNEIPTSMHIRGTTNTGAEANLFASRTGNDWSISSQDFDIATNNVKIDEKTGVVSIPISALQASSSVIATQVIAGVTSEQDYDVVPASQTPPPADVAVATPDVTVPTDGSAVITPDSDPHPDCTVITYKDESGAEQRIVVVRDKTAGTWSLKADETTVTVAENTATDNKTPFFDTTTGVVTIPALAVQDKSTVTALHKVLENGVKIDAGQDTGDVGDNPNVTSPTLLSTLQPAVFTDVPNGVVSFALVKDTDARQANVEVTDPSGAKKVVVFERDNNNIWISKDQTIKNWKVETSFIANVRDTQTGELVKKESVRFFIPANEVQDYSNVVVNIETAGGRKVNPEVGKAGFGGDETTNVPPTLISGLATGNTLELTYNETLDNIPIANERFMVQADGQSITINGVQIIDKTVVISIDPVVAGKTIQLTYKDPTANNDPVTTSTNPRNPLQDTDGNDVATFTTELTVGSYLAKSDVIDFGLIGDVNMIDLSMVDKVSLQNVTHADVIANNNNELFIKGDVGDTITLGSVLDTGSASIQVDGAGQWKKDGTTNSTVAGDDSTYNVWTHSDGVTMLYIDADMTVL